MKKTLTFALLGGDRRQVRLATLLAADGHRVLASCMEAAGKLPGVAQLPPEAALPEADCVILPLPALDASGDVNAPLSRVKISATELLRRVPERGLICGGRLSDGFLDAARSLGLQAVDYFEREELIVANAAFTAEGALQVAMEETTAALCGANVLVIGYGRIGKILTQRLSAMGARVTASARKPADLAWIRAYGHRAAETAFLEELLPEQDVVFNTVPALVLGRQRLSLLKPGCLCIDLASRPGGVDFAAASELGVKVIWALSLPGEVAPDSSGAAIRDTIYHLLEEKEVI